MDASHIDIVLNNDPVFQSCTLETVLLSGTIQLSMHTTTNNNSLHIDFYATTQGVSGTGFPSGLKYVSNDTVMSDLNVNAGATETSAVETPEGYLLSDTWPGDDTQQEARTD